MAFDIIHGTPPRCPDCNQRLTPEDSTPDGLFNQEAWNGIYQTLFLVRRPRFVCMNKACASYFPKTRRRFVRSLSPGVVVAEHFLDESVRTRNAKGKKTGINRFL